MSISAAPVFCEVPASEKVVSVDLEGALTMGRFDLPNGSEMDVVASILSLRGGATLDLRVPLTELWSLGPQVGLYSLRGNDVLFLDIPAGLFLQFGLPAVYFRLHSGYLLGNSFTAGAYWGGGITLGGLTVNCDQVLAPTRYVRWGLGYHWQDVWTFSLPGLP